MAFQLHIPILRRRLLTDAEVVTGLQYHDPKVEKWFFETCHTYFSSHFNQLFFDKDSQEEIFQVAIIKLWTEIENKTIKVVDGQVCRKRKSNDYQIMTASLTTFLMAFAKNEFRELLRDCKDDNFEEIFAVSGDVVSVEEDNEERRMQIIDECIQSMSSNCIEIITLFYYQQKTLDEIMLLRREQNTSKDGLKTAKNKCMVTLRNRVNERLNTN